jgi:hypothetical protein
MASCFSWALMWRLVLVGLVIDGTSGCHGLPLKDLSTKPGEPQIDLLKTHIERLQASYRPS